MEHLKIQFTGYTGKRLAPGCRSQRARIGRRVFKGADTERADLMVSGKTACGNCDWGIQREWTRITQCHDGLPTMILFINGGDSWMG